MKNWKTTLFGILQGAALGYVAYATGRPELFLAAVGAAAQGFVSKDAEKTVPPTV